MTTYTPTPGLPPGAQLDRGNGNAPHEVPTTMALYRQPSGAVAIYDPDTDSYVVAGMNASPDDLTAAVAALAT